MDKTIIGLEVHIEQATKSKLFCSCSGDHFGKKPNTQVCPVCMGLPGALPYTNKKAIENTILFGLALDCRISEFSKFDRKHYFYPDLPKGYQISQYDLPLCYEGKLVIPGTKKEIRIRKIHIEEDTGKLQHIQGKSLIDFNRSSVALMELVSEPDFSQTDEVVTFLKEIQRIVRYLGISTADMEKGSMRLEANVSLSSDGKLPDYKVELKNINSFLFLKKAIEAEIKRQQELLDQGKKIHQETRGYDEKTGKTALQRSKEEAHDYRYFPEPDVPPIVTKREEIQKLGNMMPELPQKKREKYGKLNVRPNYIEILVDDRKRGEYFEEAVGLAEKIKISPQVIAGVMVNQHLDRKYPEPALLVKKIIELVKKDYAAAGEGKAAGRRVVESYLKAVDDYKKGKGEVIGFLIGQVQKELKGKGEPKLVQQLLKEELEN